MLHHQASACGHGNLLLISASKSCKGSCALADTAVDIKKTSYKKLSKLLSTFEKKAGRSLLCPHLQPCVNICTGKLCAVDV